ncbi:TonB-dependent siderophore receptor [Burkholderia sp. 22PA0099]|uniref:TonB-dependent siderophore receptor n=1 Tax=Burkholderia sp. 22PA0099 TaxID=3237372 RepID=UPI0039C359E8
MNVTSRPRRLLRPRAIALAIASAQCLAAAGAHAQTAGKTVAAAQDYHLPSGPLNQVLIQIAGRTGLPLSFDPALVGSARSAPVEGRLAPIEAIRQALAGTGVELVVTDSNHLTLRRATSPAKAPVSAPAPQAAATQAEEASAELPLISVAATRDSGGTGFLTESSSTFTRTDTPLSETPKSITEINAAVIQSQNDTTLADILRNASGVITRPGPYGVPDFSIRGFTGAPVMLDGMSMAGANSTNPAATSLIPSIAIASVEVVKGPSAILAGDSPPGGVINITKKQPQAEPFHEIQMGIGMYGYKQLAFDSTGALTQDGKLLYRFVLSGDKSTESAMGYDGGRHVYFAPTIEWKDAHTDLQLGYTHIVTRDPFPQFTVGYASGGFYNSYFRQALGNREDAFTTRSDEVEGKWEQKINDHLSFVNRANYLRSYQHQLGWGTGSTIGPGNSLTLIGFNSSSIYYTLSTQSYARIKYDYGSVKSTTLIGFDYGYSRVSQFDENNFNIFNIPNIWGGYSVPPLSADLQPSLNYATTRSGLYLQEQLNIGRFHALGSIRRDNYLSTLDIIGNSRQNAGTHQSAYSPSLGLMYQLTDELAAYASYNRSFVPATAITFSGALLPPERSDQAEIGVKMNLLDDKLAVTMAAYRASYTNQPVTDPVHSGYSLGTTGSVSRGFELEFQGQVAKGLNVIGQYTYNNYQQSYNPTLRVNFPKHTASLWTTYNFQNATLQGVGFGVGLYYASGQDAGYTAVPAYHLPSQIETDVGLFYRKKHYGLNLSIKNVFNRNLYYSSTSASFIPMGPSRTVLLTGTYDF